MDHGPSRRGHFGARDGSPPKVGCADRPHPRRFGAGHSDLRIGGETSSSDRVSAVPVNTTTVWPRAGAPACWRLPESRVVRAHLRVAPPARPSPSPFGAAGTGSTQHPSRVRASDAQMLTPPGVRVRGERSLHHVRGQPRKDGGKELEPPAAALRSSAGSRTSLFGDASR
jgi:hypothetical protein